MPDGPPLLIAVLAAVMAGAILSCDSQPEATWSPAAPLEAAVGSTSWVEIAMNTNGDAVAVWSNRVDQGLDARDYSVWAAQFSPRAGWGPPTKLGADGHGASEPAIALNDGGHAVVAWREWARDDQDQSGVGIWVTRFDPDTDWEEPILIGQDGYSATVALNDNGQAALTWIESFDRLWVNRLEPESGWSAPVRLDQPCVPFVISAAAFDPQVDPSDSGLTFDYSVVSQARNPEIAMNDGGRVVVIWDGNDSEAGPLARCDETLGLRASQYAPGESWSAATDIGVPSSVFGSLHAAVAVDESGRVLAGSQTGTVTSYTESAGWNTVDLGIEDRFASVAMAESGQAMAVWEVSGYPEQHPEAILAVHFSPDEGWGDVARLSGAAPASRSDDLALKSPTILDWASTDVAVNDAGDSVVAWHQVGLPTVRSTFDVWVNHFTPGRGWSRPTALSVGDTIDAVVPRVVIDGMGRGIAVWRESDISEESRGPARLMWSRFE